MLIVLSHGLQCHIEAESEPAVCWVRLQTLQKLPRCMSVGFAACTKHSIRVQRLCVAL